MERRPNHKTSRNKQNIFQTLVLHKHSLDKTQKAQTSKKKKLRNGSHQRDL